MSVPTFNTAMLNWGRLLLDGIPFADLKEASTALEANASWLEFWSGKADHYEELGTRALQEGFEISGGYWLWLASLCCQYAQFLWFDEGRAEVQQRKVDLYHRAAPHLSPPALRLELPIDDTFISGYLRLPAAAKGRKAPCAVLLGGLAFQNAWDVITFTALFSVAVLARNLRRHRILDASWQTLTYVGPIGFVALALYLPWVLTFSSQAGGIEPYVGPGTRPAHLFLQFGVLGLAGLATAVWSYRSVRGSVAQNIALGTAWISLLPFLGWIGLAMAKSDLSAAVDARGAGGWVTLIVYALGAWALCFSAVALASRRRALAFPAACAAFGVMLLYGSELFLIKDVFFSSVPRLNTIFKLSYQAWVLLSLGGAVGIVQALRNARKQPLGYVAVPALGLVSLGLCYPLLAAFNRTNGFEGQTSVDGLAAVAAADPGEYDLVQWITNNTPRDAVVIEATGRRWASSTGAPVLVDAGVDYSDSGRISARTGRSTPIGWYFHEIQWRGDNAKNRAEYLRRQDEVDAAYYSGDPERVKAVMREFGADYLVVGRIELSRYPGLLPDFSKFLDVAHRSGNYTIYRLPVEATVRNP